MSCTRLIHSVYSQLKTSIFMCIVSGLNNCCTGSGALTQQLWAGVSMGLSGDIPLDKCLYSRFLWSSECRGVSGHRLAFPLGSGGAVTAFGCIAWRFGDALLCGCCGARGDIVVGCLPIMKNLFCQEWKCCMKKSLCLSRNIV